MKYVKLFETFQLDEAPDYDEANFNLDKIFGDDQESIETFQDIEDNGTVEDMIDYIDNWGDEEMLSQYGIRSDAHVKKLAKTIMEAKNFGQTINEAEGDWNLGMELEKNPSAGIVFWEPGMKGNTNTTNLKDAMLHLHTFFSMTAAKNYHGLIVKMLTHPSLKDNPNPRDKNGQQFPEQMDGDMNNVKVMELKDFVKKYPKAVKAVANWPGAPWDDSPWSYMYDNYFNAKATKFKPHK